MCYGDISGEKLTCPFCEKKDGYIKEGFYCNNCLRGCSTREYLSLMNGEYLDSRRGLVYLMEETPRW